ncbi:MAG: long-chain fatty acid--CoA ligase [Candidatus Delongbacteria bacterium]
MAPATLVEVLAHSCTCFPDRPALRVKRDGQWRTWTYAQVAESVRVLAARFWQLGLRAGDRVGLWSPNCPEWTLCDLALTRLRALPVPLYASSGSAPAAEILRDAGVVCLLVGGARQVELARSLPGELAGLRRVRLDTGPAGPGETALAELLTAPRDPGELAAALAAVEAGLADLGPDDLCTLIYTSGTSGEPKGVMLSHDNLIHQFETVNHFYSIDETDRSLCFLPLSHVFERAWSGYILSRGAENVYVEDPLQVAELLKEVRPTTLCSVPRLYEKIRQAVLDKAAHAPRHKCALFQWSMRVGLAAGRLELTGRPLPLGLAWRRRLADRLVLGKLRDAVGGPKKLLVSGGAALDSEVEGFFLAAGLPISQGYGLTETSPIVTCNRPGEMRPGSVGRPVPGCEIRLDPASGEILVRGRNVCHGYWNRPGATALAFDEGWFRTGDVGGLDPDGYLSITDRIKDLIITSQGKNIAPQRIEGLLARDAYIEQAAAVGDGRKCVTALVVPVFERLEAFAREHGLRWETREHLLKLPEVLDLLRRRIEEQTRELSRHEMVKRFALLPELFSEAAGEITPTLKLRRQVIQTRYRELIDSMYQALDDAVESCTVGSQRQKS